MKKLSCSILFLFLFSNFSVLSAEETTVPAPALLPDTTREMKTAGFWISRHPSPDKVVLNASEISAFNKNVQDNLGLTKDIDKLSLSFSGLELINTLNKTLEDFSANNLYLGEKKVKESFYDEMHKKMNVNGVRLQLSPRVGFIVHFADQRFFPTHKGLYEKPNDVEFDEAQNSDLDVGTPVVVLHEGKDGKWCYAESEISSGWIEKENVATGSLSDLKKWLLNKSFVVVTGAKADIFLDSKMTQYYDYVRMGTKFPMISETDNAFEISLPLRNENGTVTFQSGFMKKTDVNVGYLTFTPRTIIEQAFKLLNAPYGWGGANGEQDCSRFLQEVFSTVGIKLPRDSKNQAKVGFAAAEFDKTCTCDDKIHSLKHKALAGATLLSLKGHIMLFLGFVEDRPYAIHSLWAYRTMENNQSVAHVINRVAVTDLYLGANSKKGSLLQRLCAAILFSKLE